jgi:hypothetical protein
MHEELAGLIEEAMGDIGVVAIAHRIAEEQGFIRPEQPFQAVLDFNPVLAAGMLALAQDYATVLRAAEAGTLHYTNDQEHGK